MYAAWACWMRLLNWVVTGNPMERHCSSDVAGDWTNNALLLLAVCKWQTNQALHDTTRAPQTPTASGAK